MKGMKKCLGLALTAFAFTLLGVTLAKSVHAIPPPAEEKYCPIVPNTSCPTCVPIVIDKVTYYLKNDQPDQYRVCQAGAGDCADGFNFYCFGDLYTGVNCTGTYLLKTSIPYKSCK
ncbi:MAG: hypothetical protein L0Y72_09620 [Gemmataceae bacterium]|nr:hypothetical protein [Gemmataceae bacterium]MCI0739289.1 hypothetical protein [Gemmataceae bacterium]